MSRDWYGGFETLEYCDGCANDPKRVNNLPVNWQVGDDIPYTVTRHSTARDRRVFVFIGDPARQKRHYL